MTENVAELYSRLFREVLQTAAQNLETHLSKILSGIGHIDSIKARAKSPERFAGKALNVDQEGKRKYSNPLSEIQDQIGARVVVFYLQDIDIIKNEVNAYLRAIEWQDKSPERDAEFGYFGEHYILKMPDDAIPEGMEDQVPEFFELQIKTLFQHAWSEANHDIAYKAPRDLTKLENRQLAFSAAQSWGADQIFSTLLKDISANDDK
jgi:ppGpp synthetase/RelA/SpoT-type nucleotidyltranferase